MSTVRFLRTFVAVARHGSFAAAAERVALTQAAVSLQMRALEAELRRDLFDRSGRTVTLNAHGRALLPQAEYLLGLYDAAGTLHHVGVTSSFSWDERARLLGFAAALAGVTALLLVFARPTSWSSQWCDAFTPASSAAWARPSGPAASTARS